MEEEPGMKLHMVDGSEFEATRDNTSLFTHLGAAAIYNHVFIVTNEEKNQGSYIFSVSPIYNQMAEYMMANAYPMHVNLRQAAECDKRAWELMVHQQAESELQNGIPDDWLQ